MTQNYVKCPTCNRWQADAAYRCDACEKLLDESAPRWTVWPRWHGDDDEARHACSNVCLPEVLQHAGYGTERDASLTVEWTGPLGLFMEKFK